MRKSKLSDGTPFLGITIEHFVKKEDFAKHLAEHCHRKSTQFDVRIKRRYAMEILKHGLFFNGLDGEIDETLYEGANPEALFDYQEAYKLAIIWVGKNYPYL